MTQEPDTPSPDPVPPSSRTDLRLSDTAGDRLVTIVAWVVGLVLITALAATVAGGVWWLQKQETRFEIEPVEERVQVTLPPPAPEKTEAGDLVTRPRWIATPRPEFPSVARRAGVDSGLVELDCTIDAGGRVIDCAVLQETPPDVGFAEAAIKAAKAARLTPRTFNGEATGGRIRFTSRFSVR